MCEDSIEGGICEGCGVANLRLNRSGFCWDCERVAPEAARNRLRWRRECGIPERHAKFRTWEELQGPQRYISMVQRLRAFAETGDTVLGLIGNRGTGKTQMAAVAVWQTIEAGRAARWVTLLELLDDLKVRYSGNKPAESAWRREWSAPHLLVVDEITERLETEHSRIMFPTIVDLRYRKCRPTILIGNTRPDGFFECVGGSIADRCNEGAGGLLVCEWESFRR